MKLVFEILTLPRGGAQRMLVEITNGLVDRGHDVTIIMPPLGVVEFPIVKARIVRSGHAYDVQADDIPNGDFIISNFYTTVPTVEAACQMGRGRHVRFALCYEPAFLPDIEVSFPTYHVTDKLIVLSGWQQRLVGLNHGIRARIAPIGVGPEFKNLNLRRRRGPVRISAIVRKPEAGGYAWHRDQDFLIEQLEEVQARHPKVFIDLICPPGEYSSSPTLQRLIEDRKPRGNRFLRRFRRERFRIHTPEDDLELCRLYSSTDIYVSSTFVDAGALPTLEAMRCGAAVVTTYSGGNMEYCHHEENCLVSYRHEAALGRNILRLVENPRLRKHLAQEGEREAARWTWERSVEAFEEALFDFASRSSGAGHSPSTSSPHHFAGEHPTAPSEHKV